MRFFAVLTKLLFVAIAVELTNTANVKRSSKHCTNIIPISDYFRYGYDLTNFNLLSCPEITGKRAEVIELDHCSNGNKYRMRGDTATEYELPDGMTTFGSPLIKVENKVLINNFDEYYSLQIKPMLSFDHPRTTEISKGLFISTAIYAEIGYFALNLKMGISQWKAKEIGLQFPYSELRKHIKSSFTVDVNTLPNTVQGNEEQFLDFVKKYGTHVMSKGTFGGINSRDTIDLNNMTAEQFKFAFTENSVNFTVISNGSNRVVCEKNDGNRRIMKIANDNKSFVQFIIGGEANEYLSTNSEAWMESVKHSPTLLSAEMLPISDLIEDTQKSKNIWAAIHIYVMNAYKNFNMYYLDALLCKGYCARNETTILKQKIASMKNEDKYNATFLELLGDELREECDYITKHGKPKIPISLNSLCYFKPCV